MLQYHQKDMRWRTCITLFYLMLIFFAAGIDLHAPVFQKRVSPSQNSALESRLHDLEELLERERRASQTRLIEKEQEMVQLRQEMQAQLEEHENLLGVKLALDMEISTFRKMLEEEEQR